MLTIGNHDITDEVIGEEEALPDDDDEITPLPTDTPAALTEVILNLPLQVFLLLYTYL